MSAEIYNNFKPQIAQHIDSRLATVSDVASLPDPTVAGNFLYEGALAYVGGAVDSYYKVIDNGGTLEWQPFNTDGLVIGTINITPGTTVLDLSVVSPAIDNCYAVQINIVGGSAATIQGITNFPSNDKLLTFYVSDTQEVTFKHTDYDVASTDQIVLEVGMDMTIKGRTIGNESLTLKRHGVANCQWDATQFVKSTEWIQNLLSMAVVNNLTSTSTTLPLSAYQGNLLNQAIATKQDILTAGEKIDITGTTIKSIQRNWSVAYTGTGYVADAATALANASAAIGSGISPDYRIMDLSGYSNGVDAGIWVLPPNKDASLLSNWMLLSNPQRDQILKDFYSISDLTPGSSLISNVYYPKFSITGSLGDPTLTNLTFGTGWPAGQFVTFNLGEPGTYEITGNVQLKITGGAIKRFLAILTNTNGAQPIADPVLGGTVIKQYHIMNPVAQGFDVILNIDFQHVVYSDGATNNAFVLGISETSNNWTSVSVLDTGNLTIKKHKR